MKKESKHFKKDLAFVLLLFAVSFASLNLLRESLVGFILGIVFLIAGAYGSVSLMKLGKFIFD